VRIEYEVELYGETKKVQIPFVIGVMSDLSGDAREPLAPVSDRKFVEIERDRFARYMTSVRPRVVFTVPNTLSGEGELVVDLTFECMGDFAPGLVARRVAGVREWLTDRERLWNLVVYEDGMRPEAVAKIQSMFEDRELLEILATRADTRRTSADGPNIGAESPECAVSGRGELFLKSLTQAFGLQGPRPELERTVETFARWVIRREVRRTGDWWSAAKECVSAIDGKLSEQLNLILHHERFQRLESAWRGLHYLVSRTETGEMLKIRVINLSKQDLAQSLNGEKTEAWDRSPLFNKLYEQEYGQLGGEPYGCLVGDYYFDHSPGDVKLLTRIAQVAAAVHAPFISGAAPSVLVMESWHELSDPKDIAKVFMAPDYAAWRSLRESEDAKYIGLAVPRFLARLPHGAKTLPVAEFEFEEQTCSGNHSRYVWVNSAYAMAGNIARSFALYGWCAAISGASDGLVEGLPVHLWQGDDGVLGATGPTEGLISERREAELGKSGFLPLLHIKSTDMAVFFGCRSLQKPAQYADAEASANAQLSARLSHLFTMCRFVQTMACMQRDQIGAFKEAAWIQRWMNDWLQHYVLADPGSAGDELRAQKPLAAAQVGVVGSGRQNDRLYAVFEMVPHYFAFRVKLTTKFPLISW
jgi:type VI secretion system protein ImpC